MSGRLGRGALARALGEVVGRHEILRTSFHLLPGMELPVQVVGAPYSPRLSEVDVSALPLSARDAAAGEVFAAFLPPFDAASCEVLSVCLVRLQPAEGELLLNLPALCADPKTLESLGAEILRACAPKPVSGDDGDEGEPPMQYPDVAEWQNHLLESDETAEGVEHWRVLWRDREIAAQLDWPLPFEREAASSAPFVPGAVAVPLPESMTAGESLAGVPLQLFFLACWQVLLWRSSGHRDVLVGVLHSGRKYEEVQDVLGPFAQYLPVQLRLHPEQNLAALAAETAELLEEGERRQEQFSWELADGWTGDPMNPGVFPACFETFADAPELSAGDLRLALVHRDVAIDRFKLSLACSRRNGSWHLDLRYDRRLFDPAAADMLAERLASLMRSAAAHPEVPCADLEIVGEHELETLLSRFSHTAATVEPPAGCLHQLFAAQAARTPDREAVVGAGMRLTFRELEEGANRLAHHLRSLGLGPEIPVAVCLERSPQAVMALLGVLKAGGAWVPLDPAHPAERLAFIVEDTGAPLVITERRFLPALPLSRMRPVCLDADAAVIAACPGTNPAVEVHPENLAYGIFTSGSTGRPKGVLVAHRSPLALLAALDEAVLAHHRHGEAPLRASLNAPLPFDASVQQLVLLLAGHTLYTVPEEIRVDGPALLAFLREHRLDLFDCTPSQLRVLTAAGLLAGDGAAPEIFLVAGEAIDSALWAALGRSPRSTFYNIYGPTECTVDATAHRIRSEDETPTLGRPLAGYEIYLVDAGLRPVPIGAMGELVIGGAGLARGYARRPEATAEKFVPHPFTNRPGERLYRTGDLGRFLPNGEIEFLNRLDHQVKIRGFRIELGEIETVLLQHPWVAETAVLAVHTGPEETILAAYVLPVAGSPAGPADMRRELYLHLSGKLPAYMVPAAFVVLPAFPRLPNGKLDRRALPMPESARGTQGGYAPPRNPLEEILAGLWSDLLHLERVGVDDDFFEIGGHSLLATQLIARVRHLFQIDLKVGTLFEAPTVAGLAESVAAAQQAGNRLRTPPLSPVPRRGPLPLSYSQQRLWLHDQLEPGSVAYNLPTAVRLSGELSHAALAASFAEIVRRHEALRTTFAVAEDSREPVQIVAPAAGFLLPEVDLSALGARAEPEARRLLREVAGRPFDLIRGPLLRAVLLRLAVADHVIAVTVHHIVSDEWSMGVLVRELVTLYGALSRGERSPLPELALQYADYAHWQRGWLQGEVLESQLSYWRRQLAGAPALIRLRTDWPRPAVRSFRGASREMGFSRELSDRLRLLSRAEGCTLYMTLLSGFQVLLHHLSGEEDVVVGSPISYRNWTEVEGLIGFFVNTLPLRGDLSADPTFRELLARTRRTVLDAFAHEHVSFEMLIGELGLKRNLSHSPLFQVGFTLQTAEDRGVEVPGVSVVPYNVDVETAQFDLNLSIFDAPTLVGSFQYSRDLFAESTLVGMQEQLRMLLEIIVEDPEVRLVDLRERLAELDRNQVSSLAEDLERASAQSFRNRRRQAVVREFPQG